MSGSLTRYILTFLCVNSVSPIAAEVSGSTGGRGSLFFFFFFHELRLFDIVFVAFLVTLAAFCAGYSLAKTSNYVPRKLRRPLSMAGERCPCSLPQGLRLHLMARPPHKPVHDRSAISNERGG
ncbi:unnamed protein product [Chondrus crispus]|uniref:Uncharacterized protein n=1 Tax=Chondrus crispus TaxID=2769 RepID=R7QQ83_CHOCR|nr:unnamed protein product [Chondrus crispus]CDF39923.1 unnamed protein product [Chondrus crispus]|eukprot:XP_005710217.1 unnamed protein product [Chondrus crispus]